MYDLFRGLKTLHLCVFLTVILFSLGCAQKDNVLLNEAATRQGKITLLLLQNLVTPLLPNVRLDNRGIFHEQSTAIPLQITVPTTSQRTHPSRQSFHSLLTLLTYVHVGKAKMTIDSNSRAVCRITKFFDLCPDRLGPEHLKLYFDSLITTHSWSTVKIDRNGLQFFFRHVLAKQWEWIDIIKPPKRQSLPDILTKSEVENVINGTRELRYQTFILTTYSMGLRLNETLNLTIHSDISDFMALAK